MDLEVDGFILWRDPRREQTHSLFVVKRFYESSREVYVVESSDLGTAVARPPTVYRKSERKQIRPTVWRNMCDPLVASVGA